MKELILNKIKELKYFYKNKYTGISIDFNLKEEGVYAYYYPKRKRISFNIEIADKIGYKEFEEVIIHEFAHYITDIKYNDITHTHLWKREMIKMGINKPRAKIERNINIKGLIKVTCNCSEYMITKNRLTRLRNGRNYKCKKCGTKIRE